MNNEDKFFLQPFKKLDKTELEPDEKLRMITAYKLKPKSGQGPEMFVIYTQSNKGDKTIGRMIQCHLKELTPGIQERCEGHADLIAETEVINEKELKEVLAKKAFTWAVIGSQDQSFPLEIDTSVPGFIVANIPNQATNQDTASAIMTKDENEAKDQFISQTDFLKQTIVDVLGLESVQTPSMDIYSSKELKLTELKEPTKSLTPTQNQSKISQDPGLSNLERAALEMNLMQKFGKTKIAKLAKAINYKGTLINKTHAKAKQQN